MSPRIALLILVLLLVSFAMLWPWLCYAMAMALSRLTLNGMSIDGKDQLRGKSTSPMVEEYKNVLNARKPIKVCPKCPMLENEQDKEVSTLFSFKTAIMNQAVCLSLKGGLHITRFWGNSVQQKWEKAAIRKKSQEHNKRLNERSINKLFNYWFKNCTKSPKHSWFLRNLEDKEASEAEVLKTIVNQQAVLQALQEGLNPQSNNQQMQKIIWNNVNSRFTNIN